MSQSIIKYVNDNNVNRLDGIFRGDVFNITLTINKNGDKYTVGSQTIEIKRENAQSELTTICSFTINNEGSVVLNER